MSNEQEIKTERRGGYREGAGRPKGAKSARPRNARERDVYTAARIEQILDAVREGKVKLDAAQLKAIEIRYSRLRPMLSAIEQTIHDERDKQDVNELAARLAAMFNEKPELFEQVVALKNANAAQQSAPTIETQH